MRAAMTVLVAAVLVTGCGGSGDEPSTADGAATTAVDAGDPVGGADGESTASEATTATTTTVEVAATTTTTTTTTVPSAIADAVSIEPAVDVRAGSATVFSEVTDSAPVAAGDVVRTDSTGFAEIAYFDGSLTRLDVDTEFEVLELTDEVGGSTVRTRLDLGRTWNRVETLGEGDEFSVETSVATAVVQGTAFSVECQSDTSCTFVVVEGTVRIDLPDGTSFDLVAPAAVTVDAEEGAGDVVPVPFDGAFGDAWLFDNAGRDVDAGFLAAAEVYQAYGPSYGSISGTFVGTRTITSLECVTVCDDGPGIGDVADRSYTIDIDCSNGVPCIGTIDTEYRSNDQETRSTVPIVFDGTSYRWEVDFENARCYFDNDGDGAYETASGTLATHLEWVMTPTAAEVVGGRWVVTAMSDVEAGRGVNTVVDPGDCGDAFYAGDTSRTIIEVTRQS